MASHFLTRLTESQSQQRRFKVRKVLLESLERRELLAADWMVNIDQALVSQLRQADSSQNEFSFASSVTGLSGYDATAYLDQAFGNPGTTTSLTDRPWFGLIEDSYRSWSQANGLAFSFTSGLVAEGEEGGLMAEGESGLTALDHYVALPDSSYSFNILSTTPGIGYTLYDLEMTSQTWRSVAEANWDQWRHRMSIIVPSLVSSSKSMLVIAGGGHGGTGGFGGAALQSTDLSSAVAVAVSTGTVVSGLSNVPYQPLRFAGENFNRSEDSLIAKSYRNYLDGGDEFWPALLPMVKSAVRAMDTVQTVAQQQNNVTVTDFVVTGGSKRGWTTWLTAAVDPRVSAIAPQVINVLNMDEQMEHHRQAYEDVTVGLVGGYSVAVQDYVNLGIFENFGDPRGIELLKIVDPYEYRDRLTMPKFMINATGDEFFVPDSDQFFFHEMLGQNHLRYVPNVGHGLGPDAVNSLAQFYRAMVSGANMPEFNWTVTPEGVIDVTTLDVPVEVRLWQATNPVNRDFRQAFTGSAVQWTSSLLPPQSPGRYLASVPQPLSGHTGYMVELTYNVGGQPMKFTTQVAVRSADPSSQFDVGPRLLSVAPNSGVIFGFTELNTLQVAPTELVLRFDSPIDTTNLGGIQLVAAGKDGAFGDSADIIVTPGWVGTGENDQIIVMRFAEPLVDDLYRVQLLATGANAVRGLSGETLATRLFDSTPGDRTTESVDFRLQLGAKVLGVVPQPVDRLEDGSLNPRRDIIRVYFNDDDLHPTAVATGQMTPNPSVVDPAYYQLVFTNDTVQPGDDVVFTPSTISYNPATDMAELTFAGPIDQLVAGGGTFRLRVGSRTPVNSSTNPPIVLQVAEAGNTGSTTATALALGTFHSSTTINVSGSVITTSPDVLPLDFPGSVLEPGHRDIQDENHVGFDPATLVGLDITTLENFVDKNPQITTAYYNFALDRHYGFNAANQPVFTSITPEQKRRVREIFDIYSKVLGIDFIESESAGMTVVVGDLFPLGGAISGGGILGIAQVGAKDGDGNLNGLTIMDGAQNWNNGFGASFFGTALHEIGHLIGIGHSYDLPQGTVMGSSPELASGPSAFSFPGDHDIVHGLHLYRRDNRDVDMHSFVIPAGQAGKLELEVIAERLSPSSNLDSHLSLFKQTSQGIELVAANSASFGQDAIISLELEVQNIDVTYFVAITANGNHDFHPEVENTGSGGYSEGSYQIQVRFESVIPTGPTSFSIQDVDGTPLDGNGDGTAGGNFNFWFRAMEPSQGGDRVDPRTIFVDKSYTGAVSSGTPSQPMKNLNFNSWPANLRPQPGDIVRVAGPQEGLSPSSIPAYEFGRGGVGNQVLADGLTLQVPRGVTLMVDAGNIFKLQGSQISTGSQTAGVDHSNSAFQVLGTPHTPVYFTSYRDESLGIDTNPITTSPSTGDWGGIHFRNKVDREQGRFGWERQGIFLDYVAGANIQYGGGQVTVLNPSPVVSPLMLTESRPTILNNLITLNADSAISADPNSFQETLFSTPRYQFAESFAPDYLRVGPDIRGNRIVNNSINGLFVRTVTAPGEPLTTLDFSAKFDDRDIVHVISENLIIDNLPGGNVLDQTGPNMSLVTLQNVAGGNMTGAQVRYKLTATDRFGQSGLASANTQTITVGVGGAVRLNGLPAAVGDFVGRSLWRSTNGGPYQLVAELDRSTNSYTDTGATLQGVLANAEAVQNMRSRPNARLEIAPGTIVKLSSSRIETSIGAQLIAEGTADRPIIFTSRSDDRFGTGGTFDTFNDSTTNPPGPGNWGGLVARHLSDISLHHVLVTFGGGITSVPGGFAGFNAVEIHQSNARVANSRFENNASGVGGNLFANRDSRGPNAQSVIYVLSSQPTIIDNVFLNNSSDEDAALRNIAAISINANAMNSVNTIDRGRQTGPSMRSPVGLSNVGPLVRGNSLSGNDINGLMVRGQMLTTESIWDDTDIVHVLMNEVIVPDFHTFGGLTLRSRTDESLVVKLSGANAGFTAVGRPTDIADRIGGSLRILGMPGFPVVLTSLSDDSVGAGFDPSGRPMLDTNNNASSTQARPGDWRSVRFQPYANDRNVAMLSELERDQLQDTGSNDSIDAAQNLGSLAGRLNGGDENLRLGFSVDGSIATTQDLDIYSFSATAGTMVWLDIGRTSGALDSVLELLDNDGTILAQSTSSLFESLGWTSRYVLNDSSKILSSQVMGLNASPFARRSAAAANSSAPITDVADDFHSVNPHDAGMRIILPGTPGETSNYFIRVRSSNVPSGSDPSTTPALQNPNLVRNGLTTGTYRLQVRLRQATEVPGSVVEFADIRFATNGIEALGMPGSSPLLGQVGATSATNASNPGGAALGNILNSDRGSVSVAGNLAQATGYDEFTFTISRDSIQSVGGTHVGVTFDIDYADGFGGPNTILAVYNSLDQLVYVGSNSNIADDQPAPLRGTDITDLSRGSAGRRDAYIGPVELPAGDYRVRVTSNRQMTRDMEQFTLSNPTSTMVRFEPVNSTQRLAIERFDPVSSETNSAGLSVNVLFDPVVQNQLVQWNLSDITTYVVRNFGSGSELVFANAMTGAKVADVSRFPRVNDVAMSPGGRLVGFQIQTATPTTDANGGNLLLINSTGTLNSTTIPTNAATQAGTSGIQTFTTEQTGANAFGIRQRTHSGTTPVGDSIVFNGLTYYTNDASELRMFGVGSRGNGQLSFDLPDIDLLTGNIIGINPFAQNFNTTNIVYRLNPDTGAAINPLGIQDRADNARVNGAGTNKVEFGRFLSGTIGQNYTDGVVTGLAHIGDTLFAVSNRGEFFAVQLGANGQSGFDATFVSPNFNAVYAGVLPMVEAVIDPETNLPIEFTGLTAGPRNMHGDILFGTTANGTIYALDTAGNLYPAFPGFSYKTKTNAQGLDLGTAVRGLDFSPLDVNLWHLSDLRTGEQGHGRTVPFDRSLIADQPGTRSLYFGFRDSGAVTSQQGLWGPLYNGFYDQTYNLPGGAQGALLTKPFDLSDYNSADLPMLYFNYLLDTEDQNNDFQQNNRMRDAFRVYGAGEDGNWILLATNNTPSDQGQVRDRRNARTDELDTDVNSNVDVFGQPVNSQELFDQTGWRQARVPLGALAGKSNVRLRFEFSTAASFGVGDPLMGGMELTAVDAWKVLDGTGFAMGRGEQVAPIPALTIALAEQSRRFEFDLGLVLAFPGGSSLPTGFTITLDGTDLNFTEGVNYQPVDSPMQIAEMVRTAVQAAGLAGVSVSTNPANVGTIAIAGLNNFAVAGLPVGVIQGTPGVETFWSDPDGFVTLPVVAIPINYDMDAMQVGEAIRLAFANEYGDPNMLALFGANQAAETWPHHENIIRLYRFVVTDDPSFNDSAIGITTARFGDYFGVDPRNPNAGSFAHRDERALNNAFQGVFIDDIIVGFAERGEMVFNGLLAGNNNPFVPNREYDQNLYNINQIDTGRYQLTIRTAAEYGTTRRSDQALNLGPLAGRDFNTNDRFSRALGIEVNTDDPLRQTDSAAGRIADGTTFTLTDTKHSLTFEFDVTAGPTDPAVGVTPGNIAIPISVTATNEDIAEAIRNTINSASVQDFLNITATIRAQAVGANISRNSRIVEIHGRAATDLSGNWQFPSETHLTALRWGDDTAYFGEDLGDVDRERPQGQLILHGNTITDSANFGIISAEGDREQNFGKSGGRTGVGDRPYPGTPINYPSGNLQQLAPGVVIANNILANNVAGGLRVSADSELGRTVPIARVINNTIYAGSDGILIEGGASPTILNNIFSSANTAVRAVGATSAVLGANIYQNNGANVSGVTLGTFDITLTPSEPLFVSTTNRKFYLAAGSRAIDASLEALQERAQLTQVKSPLGLPLSPMLAPNRDVNGLLRVDDPSVNSPDGMGGNVFKDRGAVERADFVSPEAIIINPQDNDALLNDADRSVTFINLEKAELSFFSLLIQDINGVGPDASTVLSQAITLTENGKLLREGLDYVFGYNANARVVRLTPLAGIWRQDSVYEITLNNSNSHRLTIPNGSSLNDGDRITVVRGATSFVLEFDNNGQVTSGNIPVPFNASSSAYELATWVSYLINDRNISGLSSRPEGGGQVMLYGATSVVTPANQQGLQVSAVDAIRDLAGNPLQPNRATGRTQFTIVMPDAVQDFGDADGGNIPTLATAQALNGNGARHVILPIDAPPLALGTWSAPNIDGVPSVAADGDDYVTRYDLGTLGSVGGLTLGPMGPARLIFSEAAGLDGQQITITDTGNVSISPITFELDTNGSLSNSSAVGVSLLPTDTAQEVAMKFAKAVWQTILSGQMTGLVPVADGIQVSMGGSAQHTFDISAAPGVQRFAAGNVMLVVPSDLSGLADGQTMSITDSVGRVLVLELNSLGGVASGNVAVNVDLTTATSQSVASAIASAIRSQVDLRRIWLGGAVSIGPNVSILGDDEDGISFGGLFNASSAPVPIYVHSTGFGMLDAWIDWNGNGSFNDAGDRVALRLSPDATSSIATSVPVSPGINVFYVQTPAHAAVGVTTARFRLSTTGGLLPGGAGIGGEVEDHLIEIVGGSPPVANSISYSVNEDHLLTVTPANVGVLSNDTDPDIAPPDVVLPGVNLRVNDEIPGTAGIVPLENVRNGTLILNADGTFTYMPNPNFAGTDTFVYRANDGRLVSGQPATVTIVVNPINDPPQFQPGPAPVVIEDAGPTVIPNWATEILPGPPDASDELESQTVHFVVNVDRPELFLPNGQPMIAPNGTLTFQTALDANGQAVLQIVAVDSGPSNGLNRNMSDVVLATITILPINDPPVFTPGGNISVNESTGMVSQQWATAIAPAAGILASPPRALDESGQQVEFITVSVSNPGLFLADGQPSVLSDGTLQFTTAPFMNGTTLVVVRLQDDGPGAPLPNSNQSELHTFTITVAPVNDPPEFTIPSTVTISESQGPVVIQSFATNVRPGPVQAVDESSQLVHFEVEAIDTSVFVVLPEITPTGTLSFHIVDNVNSANALLDGKSLQVRVRLLDDGPSAPPNQNASAWATFTINVTPVNDPPISPDYVTETNEDTAITILASQILANASGGPTSDEGTQRVWISQVGSTSARGGLITPVFNGAGTEIISITYMPPRDAVGVDSFVFVMSDDGVPSRQGTASVIINIIPVNDAPQFDRGADQTVLEDSGPQSVQNWATNILPGPVSAIDELESQSVTFVLVVDRPELFTVSGQPAISSSGTLTFEPALDAVGVAVVRVRAVDNGPSLSPNINTSPEVLLTITLQPVNDPPVFTSGGNVVVAEDSGPYSQTWATNVVPAAGLLANPRRAIDEEGQIVSFTVLSNDRADLFAVQPSVSSTGVLSFTPAADAFGSAVIVIQALDDGPSSAPNNNASPSVTFTISITPVNDPPVANNNSYGTDENTVLSVSAPGVLVNDTDVDLPDDELFVVAGSIQSTFGASVVLNADGSFTYDPRSVLSIQRMTTGQSIIDTFVYRVRDRAGAESNQATVSITVTGIDDPPVAMDDFYSVGVGQTAALTVLANDTDVDSLINPASIQLTRLPIFGSAIILPSGIIQYTAGPGFVGMDTFGYTVRDMAGNVSNEALVTVTINDPPVANDDVAFTYKNEPVIINVLSNDTDPDGSLDPSSVEVILPPGFGTTEVLPDGRIRFTPETDFAGVVTFTYVVSDNMGLRSNEATVTVRVRNSRWQNATNNLDVNADGRISAIDALLIINYLNSGQPRFLPDSNFVPPPFVDVNGDERVTAVDALLVINELNRRSAGGGGEGEGEASIVGVDLAMMVTPQQMVDTVGRQVAERIEQQRLDQMELPADAAFSPFIGPVPTPASSIGATRGTGATSHSSYPSEIDDDLLTLLSSGLSQLVDQSTGEMIDRCFGDE